MEHSPSTSRLKKATARFAGLVMILAIAVTVSGCGREVHSLEAREGTRISLDNAFYQVQLSRQLNPKDVEDSFYLDGQPMPSPVDSYFGVFMRVDNEEHNGRILPVGIEDMKIVTASGVEYKPLKVEAPGWGYEPSPIGKGGVVPIPNSPAYIGPIRGGLLLFRMPHAALDDRPLRLEIEGKDKVVGHITLDV